VRFRINYTNDCAIGRNFAALERETRLFAATPEDKLAGSRPDRINCDERFAHLTQIAVENLNNHQLATFKRCVFDRGDHGSDDASELHICGLLIIDDRIEYLKGRLVLTGMRAIIFDFNGVIIDDEPLHLELFRAVLADEGIALSDEDYRGKYLGYDDRGCFVAALADAGRERDSNDAEFINELIERKAALYRAAINERYLLFPGVVDLVRRLANKYPLAIASGALRGEIEMVLERGGIDGCFQAIIAAEDVGACKPDPEAYLKALAALNAGARATIQPGECLVIEDSIAGVEAAKRAGMRCLAVTNSYAAEELKEADWIAAGLADYEPERLFS
jgi:beta-phosphoglucomutase